MMAYFYALCAIGLWSTNAVTAKFVLQYLPVEQVQFLQFLGAFLIFVFLKYPSGKPGKWVQFNKKAWLLGIVGLTGTMIFQYIAFSMGPITETNIIAYAWPLIAAIFIIRAGNSSHPIQLLSIAVAGFFGVGLVIGGNQFTQLDFVNNFYGFGAAITSALCMAIFSFGIGRTQINANEALLPGAVAGLIITSIWCLLGDMRWGSLWSLSAGLYLGAGPMGVGYLLWSWAMQRDTNGNTALLGFLTPVLSTGLLLSDGEFLETISFIGAVIVIGCCTLIGLRSHQQTQRQ